MTNKEEDTLFFDAHFVHTKKVVVFLEQRVSKTFIPFIPQQFVSYYNGIMFIPFIVIVLCNIVERLAYVIASLFFFFFTFLKLIKLIDVSPRNCKTSPCGSVTKMICELNYSWRYCQSCSSLTENEQIGEFNSAVVQRHSFRNRSKCDRGVLT